MTKKLLEQYTGGVLDRSLSTRSETLLRAIYDSDDLVDKVGKLLVEYRFQRKVRESAPSASATKTHLEAVARKSKELRSSIDIMPEEFKALASEKAFSAWGMHYEQFRDNLQTALIRHEALCSAVLDSAGGSTPGKRGAKKKNLERKLLSDVAELIEHHVSGVIDAAGKASEVLVHSGVHIAAENRKARNSILQHRLE